MHNVLSDVVSLLTAVFYLLLIVIQTSLSFGIDIFELLFSTKNGILAVQQPVVAPATDPMPCNLSVDTTCMPEARRRRRSCCGFF